LLKDEQQDLNEQNKGDITENLINIEGIFIFFNQYKNHNVELKFILVYL